MADFSGIFQCAQTCKALYGLLWIDHSTWVASLTQFEGVENLAIHVLKNMHVILKMIEA